MELVGVGGPGEAGGQPTRGPVPRRVSWRRRIGLYLRHDRVGADLLSSAGSDPLTVAWAGEHHRPPERWTVDARSAPPSSLPTTIERALRDDGGVLVAGGRRAARRGGGSTAEAWPAGAGRAAAAERRDSATLAL